ncbi:MAG TPA: transposase [bacterium]|jgi:hypothetical protein
MDPEEKKYPRRRSVRLRDFDYASNGAYSVTVCTRQRECLFGEIKDGELILNDLGRMVEKAWREIPNHFPSVFLDTFVLMPNHLHGILLIDNGRTGTACRAPTTESYQHPVPGSVSTVVRSFKAAVTKRVREQSGDPFVVIFQRGFHENVITSRGEHLALRAYITRNPLAWDEDENNPGHSDIQ